MADSESRKPAVKKKGSKACRQIKHPSSSKNFRNYAEESDVILNTHNRSKTLWSFYFHGNVRIPEICADSLTNQCPKEKSGCSRLHANQPWHWQLIHKDKWYNFIHTQSDVIERAFQNVEALEVALPPLNPSKTGKIGQGLLLLLGTDCWKADFNTMRLRRKGSPDSILIRRLATPSSAKFKSKLSTDYTWFIQQNLEWVEFDQYCENLNDLFQESSPVQSKMVSVEIENKYKKSPKASITLSHTTDEFIINFSKMECQSKFSKETSLIRRRPKACGVPYPAVWSRHIEDSDNDEKCTDKAHKTSPTIKECGSAHTENTWYWQVLQNDIWYNLPKLQSKVLESSYIDMWHDSVRIPGLNLDKMGKSGDIMATVLGTSMWLANFDNEILTKLNRQDITLKIRRMCPTSADAPNFKKLSKFVWFYKNEENTWVEFGYVDLKRETSDLGPQTASDQIEENFLSEKEDAMDVAVMDCVWKLDFSAMTLSKSNPQKVMAVRRRPQHARSNSIYARTQDIIPLSDASKEYGELKTRLQLSLMEPKIMTIKRLQNPELRRIFKKRQNEVLRGSKANINILTLFHWVKKGNVENIHIENFRHKHQCPEVKKYSGKGVCFFKSAEFLHKSCSPVPLVKNHRLMLFEVIISKTKEANESTRDISNLSVEEDDMTEVFCICDKRDYCPAYVIEF